MVFSALQMVLKNRPCLQILGGNRIVLWAVSEKLKTLTAKYAKFAKKNLGFSPPCYRSRHHLYGRFGKQAMGVAFPPKKTRVARQTIVRMDIPSLKPQNLSALSVLGGLYAFGIVLGEK